MKTLLLTYAFSTLFSVAGVGAVPSADSVPVTTTTTEAFTVSEPKYEKYLAPKAWEALQASQGYIMCVFPRFDGKDVTMTQGVVVDKKRGWVLSVAHGLGGFIDAAFGRGARCVFVYKGAIYILRPRVVNAAFDLALFQVMSEDLSALEEVTFATKATPFEECYGYGQKLNLSEDSVAPLFEQKLPWKARLVGFDKRDDGASFLFFDRGAVSGFSGGGIFNRKGQLVGLTSSSLAHCGYSRAVSTAAIHNFLERVKEALKNVR